MKYVDADLEVIQDCDSNSIHIFMVPDGYHVAEVLIYNYDCAKPETFDNEDIATAERLVQCWNFCRKYGIKFEEEEDV